MVITQKPVKFSPITFTLETVEEAEAFVGIMDKLGSRSLVLNDELDMARRISDMFTNMEVKY